MIFSANILIWSICTIFLTGVIMKLIVYFQAAPHLRAGLFLYAPVLATGTWNRKKRPAPRSKRNLLIQAGVLLLCTVFSWSLYRTVIPKLRMGTLQQGYFIAIPCYLLGQFVSVMTQIIFLKSGWLFEGHFQYPFKAKSLTEFWGRRWAVPVADWFREIIFNPLKKRPALAHFAVFFLSGLWHETMINVPLLLFYKINLMGSWFLYFMIQAVGIIGEKKLSQFEINDFICVIYTWILIIVPVPLALNEGVIRAFGMFWKP